jgi:hypothetical protein
VDWYILDDQNQPVKVDWLAGARWRDENFHERCVVAKDTVNNCTVSTVFLGSDHNHLGLGGPQPILFETMVFGGALDGAQHRYATWAEAAEGHRDVLRRCVETN